jgi:hypothetical protein
MQQNGPAITCEMSNTLNPASGNAISISCFQHDRIGRSGSDVNIPYAPDHIVYDLRRC